jgi:hypothetical protein
MANANANPNNLNFGMINKPPPPENISNHELMDKLHHQVQEYSDAGNNTGLEMMSRELQKIIDKSQKLLDESHEAQNKINAQNMVRRHFRQSEQSKQSMYSVKPTTSVDKKQQVIYIN